MKGHIRNKYGQIYIENDVLTRYAGLAAVECFGVVGMASVNMKDGLVQLLRRDHIKHGVSVVVNDDHLRIALHIIVAFGVSIRAVAENMISNVRYQMEEFTGMKVDKVTIFVEGVRVVD